MSSNLPQSNPEEFGLRSFSTLLPKPPRIQVDRNESYEGLRKHLLATLAPETPYEFVIAENLIAIEWDILRAWQMRDRGVERYIVDKLEPLCEEVVDHYENTYPNDTLETVEPPAENYDLSVEDRDMYLLLSKGAETLLDGMRSNSPQDREIAHRAIKLLEVDLLALMSKAQRDYETGYEYHETAIRTLESRRRQIKADYDALVNARPIEQAAVIDGD